MTSEIIPLTEEELGRIFVKNDRVLVLSSLFSILNVKEDYEPIKETYADLDIRTGMLVSRSVAKRKSRTVSYEIEDSNVIVFRCNEALCEKDAMILCAIGALVSAARGKEIPLDPLDQTDEERAAMIGLSQDNLIMNSETRRVPYTVKTSLRQIAQMIGGGSGGTSLKAIMSSIERMSRVHSTWKVKNGAGELQTVTFNLLHYAATSSSKTFDQTISISINAFTAQAFLGGKASYTRTDISDLRALGQKSSFAKMLHYRLNEHIKRGASAIIKFDTIAKYLWPNYEGMKNLSKEQRSARRAAIRSALSDLETVGWTSSETSAGDGSAAFKIERP